VIPAVIRLLKDIPRRPGTGSFDVERGADHGFRPINGDKLLASVLCSTGETKTKATLTQRTFSARLVRGVA